MTDVCSSCGSDGFHDKLSGGYYSLTPIGIMLGTPQWLAEQHAENVNPFAVVRLLCDTCLGELDKQLVEFGFGHHQHGYSDGPLECIFFLEDVSCSGFMDETKCPTPEELYQGEPSHGSVISENFFD